MALTLSHQSALDVIRLLRAEGANLQEMDHTALVRASPWVGKNLSKRNFASDVWRWPVPTANRPAHVLVPREDGRIRNSIICSHTSWQELPDDSVCWLDEVSSVVCPELLFAQMAESFPLPILVMLGHELCGHFSRSAHDPMGGYATIDIPAATSVMRIESYLSSLNRRHGLSNAREALRYVCDHALSVPESVLATVYSLPSSESGYGMGPITLNERVVVGNPEPNDHSNALRNGRSRYPDLMFPFAPVGINYDGAEHLDLDGLVHAAMRAALSDSSSQGTAQAELRSKLAEVRSKVVDDNMRNRQLASRGKIVFPATKEDLYEAGGLDRLTRQILDCARSVFGIDTSEYERILDDTEHARDRQELLSSLLPPGRFGGTSYGKM